ncbi:replication protein A 32 kDa subunit-like isoform X2 [Anarhichas minor]|uniref:replication protein A 32 kDa subunit-like isoform X2 n=1 Tax=Anarhichas minor TaxID=65739 RepID=UPI003F73CBD2
MWNQGKVANVDVTPNKENNIFLLFVLKWLKASFSRYTACSQPADGMSSQKAETLKRTTLQILPCTVSQLLSASQDVNDTFAICGWELNQDCTLMTFTSPGTYVKVTGSLRSFNGQRSLLAVNSRCIEDLNEITSHMLEVVHAHMQLFGKEFDVNMNTTAASRSERVLKHSGDLKDILPNGLSSLHGQVLTVVRKYSFGDIGISFHELLTQLDYLSMRDLRSSLNSLMNNGHVFCTMDENHFKSTEH